jgi:hypothetical protein
LTLVQLVLDLLGRGAKKQAHEEMFAEAAPKLPLDVVYRRTTRIVAWIIGFFLAIWLLGFSWALPITTLLYLKLAGREGWPISLTATLISWAVFYFLFENLLHVPFPEGLLFEWMK